MEAPQEQLQVFSAILLHQYIRLMVAATYFQSGGKQKICRFAINATNYEQMRNEPLQTALLNLDLNYDTKTEILSVTPNDEFIEQYSNAIMEDVSEKFFTNYGHRYDKFIQFLPEEK